MRGGAGVFCTAGAGVGSTLVFDGAEEDVVVVCGGVFDGAVLSVGFDPASSDAIRYNKYKPNKNRAVSLGDNKDKQPITYIFQNTRPC